MAAVAKPTSSSAFKAVVGRALRETGAALREKADPEVRMCVMR